MQNTHVDNDDDLNFWVFLLRRSDLLPHYVPAFCRS